MVSIPVDTIECRKTLLFPSAVSPAFAYNGSYVSRDSLWHSTGYWIKLPAAQEVTFTGVPRYTDSIAVHAGWNLIGTISDSLPASSVAAVPPGIMSSAFFGFNESGAGSSYSVASMLKPGYGYWIKVNADGILYLQAPPTTVQAGYRANGK